MKAALSAALLLLACPVPGPAQERPYLELARGAGAWLEAVAVETDHGLDWPVVPDQGRRSANDLYSGIPGVILFFLEAAYATGEEGLLRTARRGADTLLAQLDDVQQPGLYTGLAGIAFTLDLVEAATGDRRYGEAARSCLDRIAEMARPVGTGVHWNGTTDMISGSAGIGLYLLWEARNGDDEGVVELGVRAGDWLLEQYQAVEGGWKWPMAEGSSRLYPNFSHGTAGVCYFLARLAEETGETRFRDAALQGGRYLRSVAGEDGLVFHHEPDGEDLFYLGWCHGPTGTVSLYEELAELTGDQTWEAAANRAVQTLFDTGIPEKRVEGFWNNVGQCCGSAGVGELFLRLYGERGEARDLSFCARIAADLASRAEPSGEGLKWVQAEHRVQPERMQAQTGLMQGAAGIGLWLLHLDGHFQDREPLVVLPDAR